MKIYSGPSYVLAYVPASYVFSVRPYEQVSLSVGNRTVKGVIDELLPVADALPPEFQNTFRPRSRNRIIRVIIDGDVDLAVSQTVRVGYCYFGNCNWAATALKYADKVYAEAIAHGEKFVGLVKESYLQCKLSMTFGCVQKSIVENGE